MPQVVTAPGVYVEETRGAAPVARVATSTAVFVGRTPRGPVAVHDGPAQVRGAREFEQVFGDAAEDLPLGLAVRDFFAHGGREAWIVRLRTGAAQDADAGPGAPLQPADYIGDAATGSGLHALARIDAFNLLCLPPDVPGGDVAPEVWRAALAQCVQRRAMLLVDAPAAWDDSAALPSAAALAALGLDGDAARNAALYYPRLVQPGAPGAMSRRPRVPCGAVAGLYAATDLSRGVWKAPAGLEVALRGGLLPSRVLTDAQQAQLNVLGINCLRRFPQGSVVWGARTLAGADTRADAYKYVPVRRMALHLHDSLERGLAWTVFEPNDETLWARVRLAATAFLQGLFREGAFQGATPREAYLVRCDAATTTAADVAAGRLRLLVGFAPLKPAEFVTLSLGLPAAPPV